jgi:hypothetical protein
MMREYIVSVEIADKFEELISYLKNDLKLSEQAALEYRERFVKFIRSFGANVDHPLCRFKRWRLLGYRCAVFEKDWILAYETLPEGAIVRDISHRAALAR